VAQAQTTLPPVIVVGTQPGGGLGSGGGGGGYGGSYSAVNEEEPNIPDGTCEQLAKEKPAECPSPIPHPFGPTYAQGQFAAGAAVPRAIAFMSSPQAGQPARDRVAKALSDQTQAMSGWWNSRSSINSKFSTEIRLACEIQVAWSELNPLFGSIPVEGTRQCAELYNRTLAEASETDFGTFFLNWLNVNGIDLTDLPFIGNTLINQLSSENSLASKHKIVAKDQICAMWWQNVEGARCDNP
jgi:hypothetical protein